MATMRADVVVDREAIRARKALVRALETLPGGGPVGAALVEQCGDFDAKQNQQAFASEGEKSGEKWPDLLQGEGNMKGYRSWKRRNWPGKKLLVWRGDARKSLTQKGPERIARLVGSTLEFGSKNRIVGEHMKEQTDVKGPIFLKEKNPIAREPKPLTDAQVKRGRVVKTPKPIKWFVFWPKRIPARPAVRKSETQVRHLKLSIARVLMVALGKEAGGVLGSYLRVVGGSLRPDPRA